MTSLTIEQKRVDIYPSAKPGSPVIYLNTFSNAVNSVYKNLMALGCPDFCLVAVSELKWDHDMTPWYMGPISKHDTPCTGGADDYLKLLLDEIMPEAEALLPGAPAWRGLAGYSLAGLFALWASTQTDLFYGVAAASPSVWFPGWMEFEQQHPMQAQHVYLSLGDKEERTKNTVMAAVGDNIRALHSRLTERGANCTLEWNNGGHFKNADLRTAKAFRWAMEEHAGPF